MVKKSTQKFINFNIRVPKEEVARTLKILKQKGTSNLKIDEKRTAMLPGKRISKTGKIYFESRRNRSDSLGSKV